MSDEARVHGGSARDSVDVDAGEVVEEWLSELTGAEGSTRSGDLLDAYRALGLAVIDQAVSAGSVAEDAADRSLDRALGGVAAEVRRSRMRIAEALEDLDRLGPTTERWLRHQADATERELGILRCMADIVQALDVAVRRVVRALEDRAFRAERERSDALAAMTDQLSHELSNRLGAARTASQMLTNPEIDLDQGGLERVAELVEASVDAALDTVGDVRALYQSGTDEHPRRTTPLPKLIRTVVEDLSPTALEADVAIEVEDEVVDCEVDAARLRLIVFNLVGNGIKYSDPARDPSVVRVRTERLDTGEVELRIEDNGVGIPEEDLEDIFLHHVRGSETAHVSGTGVGLAIVLEAIEQIGGSIDVDSELAAGTTFTVRFRPFTDGRPEG